MNAIISKEKINKGRQIEIDLLRGFSAILMIICHVGLYMGDTSNTGLFVFSDIIGSEPAAPIFMVLMGICVMYSSHDKPIQLFKRGLILFFIGYLVNLYRSLLPYLIFGNINQWSSIEAFFIVDIFQFSGLSFMLIALFRKLKVPSYIVLLISIVMVIVNQYLMLPSSLPWDSKILTGIVDLFTPVSEACCFPFLSWFFFPAFGMVFGELLIRIKDKDKFYLHLLIIGLIGVLYVYVTFYKLYPDYTSYYYGHNYYYMGLKNVLITCCFVFFGLSFWYYVNKILPKFINNYLSFLSKNLIEIYVISWVLITSFIYIQSLCDFNFDVLLTILSMVVVVILSSLLTRLYIKIKTKIVKK